jgi:hypothetical protein
MPTLAKARKAKMVKRRRLPSVERHLRRLALDDERVQRKALFNPDIGSRYATLTPRDPESSWDHPAPRFGDRGARNLVILPSVLEFLLDAAADLEVEMRSDRDIACVE